MPKKTVIFISIFVIIILIIIVTSIILLVVWLNDSPSDSPPNPPDSPPNSPSNSPSNYPSSTPITPAPEGPIGLWYYNDGVTGFPVTSTQQPYSQAAIDFCNTYNSQLASQADIIEGFDNKWNNYCNGGWAYDANFSQTYGYYGSPPTCPGTGWVPDDPGGAQGPIGVFCVGPIPEAVAGQPTTSCSSTSTGLRKCYIEQ